MMFLQFIRQYWNIIVIIGAFGAGWHLKALSYSAEEKHALVTQAEINDKAAIHFEKIQTILDKQYDNLNTKVTYANTYNCIIPADGLRLLAEATSKTR